MGKYDDIDFKPSKGAKEEAARGLEWRREFGRGGTAIGVARARDISNGKNMSPSTVKRMKAYFDRHVSDSKAEGYRPGEEGYPSAGRIAHALWGGDPGYVWAEKVVKQMNAADERNESMDTRVERRSLSLDENSEADLLQVETRSETIEVNGEKRDVKREWIVGYAARFGVDSLDMGDFVERIDPSAFKIVQERRGRAKKPLQTRALFNHDPNIVLGRFPDTLRMYVDERGLRYEVMPPEYRSDIVESIKRGDIRGSSFSFVVAEGGEEWTQEEGRSIRTVTKVEALYDVGPVTYPAYPDSDVQVAKRSWEMFSERRTEESDALKAVKERSAKLREFAKKYE